MFYSQVNVLASKARWTAEYYVGTGPTDMFSSFVIFKVWFRR